jgi:ABC-2 type transport system ATP-binding protein
VTAVNTEGLRKVYGGTEAVVDLDLAVPSGIVFGFLGPNGAGKSTTIGMLCTLLRPTAGHAEVAGFDVVREAHEVRRRIGLVFQETTLDLELTADQNLSLHATLFGLPRRYARDRITALLGLVDLIGRRNAPVGTYSAGMRRRLEIARGLLHTPDILFLSEQFKIVVADLHILFIQLSVLTSIIKSLEGRLIIFLVHILYYTGFTSMDDQRTILVIIL